MPNLTHCLQFRTAKGTSLRRHCVTRRPAMATQFISDATTNSTEISGETVKSLSREVSTSRGYRIRQFDYHRDTQDLIDICSNVYGGTDYMPRIIHRISRDPGVLVLAAEAHPESSSSAAAATAAHDFNIQEQQQQQDESKGTGEKDEEPKALRAASVDGVICGERRGDAIWVYGLRVREGIRGRGLGHQLMQAIVHLAPQQLASAPDAHPPPPRSSAPVSTIRAQQPSGALMLQPAASAMAKATSSPQPQPPLTPEAVATPRGGSGPIRQITTCTVTYNAAAQRIIGRQLLGPLYEVEVWPGQQLMEAYEVAVGWVRGVGLPQGAPCQLDWWPGVRQVLEADNAAQALLPHWRRVRSDCELRSAVNCLLYGSTSRGGGADVSSSGGDGGGGGGDSDGGASGPGGLLRGHCHAPTAADAAAAASTDVASGQTAQQGAVEGSTSGELLWLPMPYDLWPLDSAFVQRELAAGNVWVLTEPATRVLSRDEGREEKLLDVACRSYCGRGPNGGLHMAEEDGVVVGVMLLTHFETLSRVCAGILARNNQVVHAAIAHAGRLQPHFWVSTLRMPAGCKRAGHASERGDKGTVEGNSGAQDGELVEPLPELYGVSGGHRGVLIYGGMAPATTARPF